MTSLELSSALEVIIYPLGGTPQNPHGPLSTSIFRSK